MSISVIDLTREQLCCWYDQINISSDIVDARILVMLGDSVTTDHISPAGAIKESSPAGYY